MPEFSWNKFCTTLVCISICPKLSSILFPFSKCFLRKGKLKTSPSFMACLHSPCPPVKQSRVVPLCWPSSCSAPFSHFMTVWNSNFYIYISSKGYLIIFVQLNNHWFYSTQIYLNIESCVFYANTNIWPFICELLHKLINFGIILFQFHVCLEANLNMSAYFE